MMQWWQAIILGVIEGVTEFLPVSSTGHLTIAEKLMGLPIDDIGVTAFTAVIQIGAILAAIVYFRHDIMRVGAAWLRGILQAEARRQHDYILGWAVIVGTIPIAVVGLLFKHQIETVLRSLWWVAIMLIVWSGVMWYADRYAKQRRHEAQVRPTDALKVGLMQCIALIPGVSRSGATIAGGLLLGFDRMTATRLSFFLGIPALLAAGVLEAITQAPHISSGVGWQPTIVASLVSFLVGYVAVAWMIKFIARHDYTGFIIYRVVVGLVIIGLLVSGVVSAA